GLSWIHPIYDHYTAGLELLLAEAPVILIFGLGEWLFKGHLAQRLPRNLTEDVDLDIAVVRPSGAGKQNMISQLVNCGCRGNRWSQMSNAKMGAIGPN